MCKIKLLWSVASFDFIDSLRSRKVLAVLLLYCIGALGGTAIFAQILSSLQARIGDPQLWATFLMQDKRFFELISGLVGDRGLARSLLTTPPLALFYGWLALIFAPFFVILNSSDVIAADVGSGAARFALSRVGRLTWALGRLAGQIFLMTLGLLVGGVSTFLLGMALLGGLPALPTALWLLRVTLAAWFYALPFVGLALAVSQLTRSANLARALGLISLVLCAIAASLLGSHFLAERLWPGIGQLRWLLPQAYKMGAWRLALGDSLWPALALVSLCMGYFSLGYLRFHRRDA